MSFSFFLLSSLLLIFEYFGSVYGQIDTDLVCSDEYSGCACEFANLTNYYTNLTKCFSEFVCEYDVNNGTFCSNHGTCDFSIGACLCESDYAGDDCSSSYSAFVVAPVITYGLVTLGSVLSLFCVFLMSWLYNHRSVSDVKAMSVTFTQLTLVGCLLICLHAIVVGIGFNQINCVLLEWFAFLGICLLIGCALLKAYRIASIFSNQSFSPNDLTDSVLLKYLLIFMIIDIIFLTIYTIFNFEEGGSYGREVEDKGEYFIEQRCSSKTLTSISYYVLVSWQILLLSVVLYYGNKSNSASKVFKETKCIYVMSNLGALFFIAFGILILFTSNYQFQIVTRGFGSLGVVMGSLGLLFYPKYKAVYKPPNQDSDGLTENERALSKQYEVNLKDRMGKELLLLLDNLVRELVSRVDNQMLKLEFESIDVDKVEDLMKKLIKMSPDRQMKPVSSKSDLTENMERQISSNTNQN